MAYLLANRKAVVAEGNPEKELDAVDWHLGIAWGSFSYPVMGMSGGLAVAHILGIKPCHTGDPVLAPIAMFRFQAISPYHRN